MKIGIIGCGGIANVHGPCILKQSGAEIVGVADKDLVRAATLGRKLGVANVYGSGAEMIDAQKPDIVHVLVPPDYHASVSIMALDRGCHGLVEKPMALSKNSAKEMAAAATRNNVLLCVGHSMVLDYAPHRAIQIAKDGLLGNIVSIETSYVYDCRRIPDVMDEGAQYSHWFFRLNGGLLQDLIPHPCSLVVEFLNEIDDVYHVEFHRGLMPKGWPDEVRVLARSKNVSAYMSVSLAEAPDAITMTIKGTEGVVHADLFNNSIVIRKKSDLPRAVIRALSGFQLAWQYCVCAFSNVFKFGLGRIDHTGGISPLIDRFYTAVQNNTESPISLDNAIRAVELMERIWPDRGRQTFLATPNKRPRKKASVLVTGASGFIGTHLIRKLLSEGHSVRALVRPNSLRGGRLKMVDVEVFEADLADYELLHHACDGIRHIYHAGSDMSSDWEIQERVTVQATKQLVDAAKANQIERFLHFSSLAVLDHTTVRMPRKVTEDCPYKQHQNTMGAYAYAKIQTEQLLLSAYKKDGLPITIVRPGIVIGPMGRLFFPHLGYRYANKYFFIIGDGKKVLPLTYVENTVDAIYRASQSESAIGQIYNIVDDGEVLVCDYLQRFKEMTGGQIRINHVPYFLAYAASAAYEMAASLGLAETAITSRAQLKSKQADVLYDNAKTKFELDWTPTVSIDEGIRKTFEWHISRP